MFKVHRSDNFEKFRQYIQGIFHSCKNNIARMDELIESSKYQQLQHFISDSPWDYKPILKQIGIDMCKLFKTRAEPVGLIIDESGHKKSGKNSVGVSRQYLGSVGKNDNGQVAVLAALVQGDDVAMVDTRLYLAQEWTKDEKRCDKAGVPKENQIFKTKPVLALDMVKDLSSYIEFDWVGGDAVYGDSTELRKGINSLGRIFVMDVRGNQRVYLEHPNPYIPTGAKNLYKSNQTPIEVRDLLPTIPKEQWKNHIYRVGTKGDKTRQLVCLDVYIWVDRRNNDNEVEKLRLIISRELDGTELKFSITNDYTRDNYQASTERTLLYRQMHRYWIERGIQDCKDSLGMTDYQVRSWRAWHHHMTLTMMALQFIAEQKILKEDLIPLLSCPDIKFFLAQTLGSKVTSEDQAWHLIRKRHELRQKDLDRYKKK